MAATSESVRRAERAILDLLEVQSAPISPQDVKTKALQRGVDGSVIVSAIWFLIDRHKIILTDDLKLLAVK